jgi:hypothetical protein
MVLWLLENDVAHMHVSSGPEGYSFMVQSHIEWFNLKWL